MQQDKELDKQRIRRHNMDNKDKEMIKRTVRGLYRDNLISFEIKDDKRICIEVQGKAYGDGYSSYVCARYKDGVWQESQIGGRSDLSSIDILEKKLGVDNLKKLSCIELDECYD